MAKTFIASKSWLRRLAGRCAQSEKYKMEDDKVRVSGQLIDSGIERLQTRIGLEKDFFKNLLEDDDWSFVIKLHALIEAVCSGLLTFHFNEPKLGRIFSRIELSDKTKGKIQFLKETGLIDEFDRKYIAALSELRNRFVHDVKNCGIKLNDVVNSYDKNQMKNFAINFSPFESQIRKFKIVEKDGNRINKKEKLDRQATIENVIKRAKENPKSHIWIGGYNLLVNMSEKHYYSDYLQWKKAHDIMDREDEEIL